MADKTRSIFEDVGDVQKQVAKPGGIDRGGQGARGAVRAWLMLIFGLVGLMIIIGGMTRLTDSGLSITEWAPLAGAMPPTSEAVWLEEFDKYKAIPEYQLQNKGMSLAEFKTIYWWEWGHRQLGRVIGLVWALVVLAFVQILIGALVAGIDAGRNYTDWPLMAGGFLPPDPFGLSPLWRNFFEDDGLVQFMHRMAGYILFGFGVFVWARARKSGNTRTRFAFNLMLAVMVIQVVLGIVTVMYSAPWHIAIVHQLGAVVLWVVILRARFLAAGPKNTPPWPMCCMRAVLTHAWANGWTLRKPPMITPPRICAIYSAVMIVR